MNPRPIAARILDTVAIATFFVAEAWILAGAWGWMAMHPLWTAALAFASYIGADLLSATVHWAGDTWGNPNAGFIGRHFVHPFREHHVDPTAMTRHGFLEVNGNNCLISLIALIPAAVFIDQIPALGVFVAFQSLGVMATNQMHKWAHMDRPPAIGRLLQKLGLSLTPAHHALHHAGDHLVSYGVTTGWTNPLLDRLKVFRGIERIVEKTTGLRPRAEHRP